MAKGGSLWGGCCAFDGVMFAPTTTYSGGRIYSLVWDGGAGYDADMRGAAGIPTNGKSVISDHRLDAATSRTDDVSPFARSGDGIHSSVKSGYMGDGGGSLYRWVAALGGDADLNRPYAQHPWVYACVAAIGRAASSVPARFQKRLSGGDFETIEDSHLGILLGMPNPLQSERKFFRSLSTSQMLYGETFLILLKRVAGGRL